MPKAKGRTGGLSDGPRTGSEKRHAERTGVAEAWMV